MERLHVSSLPLQAESVPYRPRSTGGSSSISERLLMLVEHRDGETVSHVLRHGEPPDNRPDD
jgi:hypothetical protein